MDVSSKTETDLEKILKSLEKEKDKNQVERLKVECKVNKDNSSLETDKITGLEGKVISAESRLLSIEKESINAVPRLEKVEKCIKIKDKEIDDLRSQFEKEILIQDFSTVKKTDKRFRKLEEFNSDIKEKFINLLEICEGFQSELEEIKQNNIHLMKPIEKNVLGGCSLPTRVFRPAALSPSAIAAPTPSAIRSSHVPAIPSPIAAPVSQTSSKPVNWSKRRVKVSFSKSEPSPTVVERFQSQSVPTNFNDVPNRHKPTTLHAKFTNTSMTRLLPSGAAMECSRYSGFAMECSRYSFMFPVEQQVIFGPIPAAADHDVAYQFLRSSFHFIGQVCSMFLSPTIERDLVTGELVKFGNVVFVDELSAHKAVKIGKIVMPDGFEVLLKEVPKPWLAS